MFLNFHSHFLPNFMQTPQAIHVLLKNQKQFHSSRDQFLSKWVFIFPGFLTSIVNPYITYNRSNGFRSIFFWLFERIWWYQHTPKKKEEKLISYFIPSDAIVCTILRYTYTEIMKGFRCGDGDSVKVVALLLNYIWTFRTK